MNKGLLFNVVSNDILSRTPGVYRIAHYLREKNFDIEVIDYSNYWTVDELEELFKSRYNKSLKFIGFGHLFSTWFNNLEEFCQWIKTNYPDVIIISGSSVNPLFDSDYIDYYIQGYGENAVDVLLKYLIGNGTKPIFNTALSTNKKIISANENYPAFPMKSLMVKYEDRDFIQPYEWLGVEFSRGCKFKCDFCNFPILGVKGDYSRDANDFEYQIKDAYDRFGSTNYLVADETFNDRTEKITKFANVVENLPFQTFFSGFVRPDLLVSRPKDREELLRMNFLGHYYGVESFNHQSAKVVGKGMDTDRLLNGLIEVKDFFMSRKSKQYIGTISLIIGLPYDTKETVEFTKQWLINNWQEQCFVAFYLQIPAGELEAKSSLSIDYEKYGYEKIGDNFLSNLGSQAKLSKTDIIWKNKNMNIFEAARYSEELNKLKYSYNFSKSNFTAPIIKNNNRVSFKKDLNYKNFFLNHVKSYIQKKLSI